MDVNNSNMIQELISAYLSNEISSDNRIIVESWIHASDENKLLFEEYKAVWLETGNITPTPVAIDVEVAWQQMSDRIDEYELSKKTFTIPQFLKIAAIIIIPIVVISISYLLLSNPEAKIIKLEATKITNDTLQDGSIISLQANSSIEYSTDFNTKNRIISMKGEAFFDIAHNKEKPFIIKTENSIIKVVGTKFNVKSFSDSSQIEVLVESGKVIFMVVQANSNDTSSITLTAGEKGIYNKTKHSLSKISNADNNELFWKTKTLLFNKAKLSVISSNLETYYNTTITVDPRIESLRLTTEFSNEPIDSILTIIKQTLNIQVIKEGNSYKLIPNE